MLLQAALILAVCGAFVWVTRRRHRHGLFERHGVPGPKPDLLWGNWKQLKKDRIQVMDQWIQYYGKVFGIYLGDKPFMVVTDVGLIKECFIKATKVFQDRPMYAVEVEPLKTGLLLLRGDKWRKVRSVFNACFSAGKVKELFGIINGSITGLVQKFDEAALYGDIVDAHEASRGMVLEMITKTVLGRETDRRKKSDDPVHKSFEVIFQEADNALFESAFAYPGLRSILQCLYPFTSFCKAVQKVMEHTLIIINKRRSGENERKVDVLQHILDAQEGVSNFPLTSSTNARFMDDHTLLCNIAVHIIAGFDTTSASLGFLLYLLAKHPEEQQKVRAEIERRLRGHTNSEVECDISNFEEKRELEQKRCQPRDNVPGSSPSHSSDNPKNASQNSEYESLETKLAERTDLPKALSHQRSEKSDLDEDEVMLLERLDMVVREGMRLYPAIPITVMRECVEDTTIMGRFIPAGTSIFAPPWHVHRNPEIWPEPNRFLPDRFSPTQRDSVACSYFPFGLGPRMCVAHRLAMVTLKTALYRLIRNFEISLAGDIPDPLPVFVDHVILNPAVPIKLRVKRIKLE
ncbi:cytochrome P450 3A29-like [Dermacentor andersoni]|uniref:cytochrome P450 3A29-like n=1 Tax=Dermacentor andersoni TaxID=34620 RepID=UPI002155747E|nr:cytochrome P450 3A29-like [Dermacentor andersoni]